MTIQDRVNGAAGWHFHCVRQSSKEALPDLAGAPVGFLALGGDDGGFDLLGQSVGVTVGTPSTIGEPLQPTFLIAVDNLITGLARDSELPEQSGHALAILPPNHEAYTFVHNRTFLPWHPSSRPLAGEKV